MWLLYNKYNLFFTKTNVISFLTSPILSLFKDKTKFEWLIRDFQENQENVFHEIIKMNRKSHFADR